MATSKPTDDAGTDDVIDIDALMADLRRRAAEKKAQGLYSVDALAADAVINDEPFRADDLERLRESAVHTIDLSVVQSQKPVVGPIVTRFKRLATRSASQPVYSLAAQNNAFNADLLRYVALLGSDANVVRRTVEGHGARVDELSATLASANDDISAAVAAVTDLAGKLERLDERLDRIEHLLQDVRTESLAARLQSLEARAENASNSQA